MKFHERKRRSLAKTASYIAAVATADVLVILFITHRTDQTFEVIIATNLISAAIYFLHARIWNKIHWGRIRLRRKGAPKA